MIAAVDAVTVRTASTADIPALNRLIERSARTLSRGYYDERQIEAAITHVFGVDSQLVVDGTYFVAMWRDEIAGCGGWSRRSTLFGGDGFVGRCNGLLNPTTDPARIRAFFVGENQARRGVGRALLATCEDAAVRAGFLSATLMATLPGIPFYAACGYRADGALSHDCNGVAVPFVSMTKRLVANL